MTPFAAIAFLSCTNVTLLKVHTETPLTWELGVSCVESSFEQCFSYMMTCQSDVGGKSQVMKALNVCHFGEIHEQGMVLTNIHWVNLALEPTIIGSWHD